MPITLEQGTVFAVLAAAMLFFVWGRWRYDIVAVAALLCLVLIGIIPAEQAFSGFSHPAVITVAAVLVIGQALKRSGWSRPWSGSWRRAAATQLCKLAWLAP